MSLNLRREEDLAEFKYSFASVLGLIAELECTSFANYFDPAEWPNTLFAGHAWVIFTSPRHLRHKIMLAAFAEILEDLDTKYHTRLHLDLSQSAQGGFGGYFKPSQIIDDITNVPFNPTYPKCHKHSVHLTKIKKVNLLEYKPKSPHFRLRTIPNKRPPGVLSNIKGPHALACKDKSLINILI